MTPIRPVRSRNQYVVDAGTRLSKPDAETGKNKAVAISPLRKMLNYLLKMQDQTQKPRYFWVQINKATKC